MTDKLKRVLIMAGGTGGHIFPGLAVADYLQKQGVEVHWLGTELGLEAKLLPETSIPFHMISITGLRGKGLKKLCFAPFQLVRAVLQAITILKKVKPDVVLGMGGFASGPGGMASWLLRYPLVIHEQNAKAGMTNKMLAKLSRKILTGFPHTFDQYSKSQTTGNPVRPEIMGIASPEVRKDQSSQQPLNILVLGGSLGAKTLNDIVPLAVAQIDSKRPYIYHQTGSKHLAHAMAGYEAVGVQADIVPFINEMDHAYAWADLVICRAGALTVAELCAAGVGAIFVPYPYAVDDHQTANANFMVEKGAGIIIQETDLCADSLSKILQEFIDVPERCNKMAKAAYSLRKDDSVLQVSQALEEAI